MIDGNNFDKFGMPYILTKSYLYELSYFSGFRSAQKLH